MISIVLRTIGVILIGLVSVVIGFIVVVNIGFMIAPEFSYNGREGYEAAGPISLILGALLGLFGSYPLFFGRRITK